MESMPTIATVLFACAILHTFLSKQLLRLAHRFPPGSIRENALHFLGEVEVVFGFWAAIFIGIWCVRFGTDSAAKYLDETNYTEAAFVFVIMCMAATRPVLDCAKVVIGAIARVMPVPRPLANFASCMIVGPLLGSLITEPAAMTVTAILLRDGFLSAGVSQRFRYVCLGLLFVSISIGGTMTNFAAPPILMVAGPWNWSSAFVFEHIGVRALGAILLSVVVVAAVFRRDIMLGQQSFQTTTSERTPAWVMGVHLMFMALTVVNAHHMSFFIPVFLFFLGWCAVSKEYQDDIRLRESLLVGFFLGGLVTLGRMQEWWIQPLINGLDQNTLFWSATALTAVTDNAALTYLGTLVPDMPMTAKLALVAGAVCGGGLTVIANAPNPAGYGILRDAFGEDGISPLGLFVAALPFTIVAAVFFLV